MFELEYNGANSVTISTKKETIVVDPKLSVVGLKDESVKGVVELATEARFAVNSADAKLVIEGPGEYGVADFDIRGIAAQRHIDTEADPKISTVYRIVSGEIRVAVIGNIADTLDDDQLEEIGMVDVLVIPVGGGGYTLDATSAASITRQIEPKIVIPVHYSEDGVKYEVPQLDVETFIGELGVNVEEAPKLKLKTAAALPPALTVFKLARS